MITLKSAEEMYQYCLDNKFGNGTTKGWSIKHFKLLIDNLLEGEDVHCVFMGLHNYKSMSKHDGNFAYAITNKRFIMAQQKLIGSAVQSVNINNINDITLDKGLAFGTLCIDTYKETFNVCVEKNSATNICNTVHSALEEIKGNLTNSPTSSPSNDNSVEKLKEMKELLDMGIITQGEFDLKKKQLLGL